MQCTNAMYGIWVILWWVKKQKQINFSRSHNTVVLYCDKQIQKSRKCLHVWSIFSSNLCTVFSFVIWSCVRNGHKYVLERLYEIFTERTVSSRKKKLLNKMKWYLGRIELHRIASWNIILQMKHCRSSKLKSGLYLGQQIY